MTLPRAMVEAGVAARAALQDACLYWSQVGKCCCSGTPHNDAAQDAVFATAVLAAFFAGEVEGDYFVVKSEDEEAFEPWAVCRQPLATRHVIVARWYVAAFRSEAEARRVAHALNWEGK